MCQPERPNTPMADIVAVAMVDEVVEEDVEEETDARSTDAHTAKWTTIPPKHEEGENALNTT
jgi:hypothetical protein